MINKITQTNFETEVLGSTQPVVLDFYADWCGPCKMLSPIIEELANEYEEIINFGKVNVDEEMGLATTYGIMSIPTLLFFYNGDLVEKVVGLMPKGELKNKIQMIKAGE